MIVPMKKVSLIIKGDKKRETLKELRKMGILQIEIAEGSGEKLDKLREKLSMLESSVFSLQEKKQKKVTAQEADVSEATAIAEKIVSLADEKKDCTAEKTAIAAELERIKSWGDIDPDSIHELSEKGVRILLYEMPKSEYKDFGECVRILYMGETKTSVRFLIAGSGAEGESEVIDSIKDYQLELPQCSTVELRQQVDELNSRIEALDEKINSNA